MTKPEWLGTDEILVRIDAPYFTAGIIVRGNKVIEAAPILAWSVGKTYKFVQGYCDRRRWPILEIHHKWFSDPRSEER